MKTTPQQKSEGFRMDDDRAELALMKRGAVHSTPAGKAEDISDSHNRTSQSALQRNQIKPFRGPAVSAETIKRPQNPE